MPHYAGRMDHAQRIAQFENMAQADPTNEMAHFSLGRAYADAGRHEDAAAAFLRCVEVAPDMSKAYQLAAESFIKAGRNDRAGEVLKRGLDIAASRGDRMPARAIAQLMRSIGLTPPMDIESAASSAVAGARLDAPPFKGPIGRWIYENVPADKWRAWIAQGTKVINELRLDLSRDDHAETYDRYMREYLGIDDELYERLTRKQ